MTTAKHQYGRTDLPAEQQTALRQAVCWELFTIGYTAVTILLVATVVGSSQSMKTAWIEDMLSLMPQLVFLIALPFVRRRSTTRHPYGWHRAMSVGHLVAGVALLAVGLNLAVEAAVGLIKAEHPTIGSVNLFGTTVWLGWLMVAVMVVVVIGPLFFYGPAKVRIAPTLHNKVLYADGDMAKADWHTNAASIVGVLGVGVGLWWLDGAAALFISLGIVHDGFRNTKAALGDLMDQRALAYDSEEPHPAIDQVRGILRALPWVDDAGVRIRDMGQVLHVEAFVVPQARDAGVAQIREAPEAIADASWQMQDVVVTLCDEIPEEAVRPERA